MKFNLDEFKQRKKFSLWSILNKIFGFQYVVCVDGPFIDVCRAKVKSSNVVWSRGCFYFYAKGVSISSKGYNCRHCGTVYPLTSSITGD